MKHTALLSFICLLFSCKGQSDKSDFASLIKGDWIGPEQQQDSCYNETMYLCFDDSTLRYAVFSDALKYEIRKDTLYFQGYDDDEQKSTLIKYPIAKLTTDSLILLPGTYVKDTVKFSKVHPQNNITPAAIYFGSSGSPGNRSPRMFLEIDSSLNIRFYGSMYTSIQGGFSGRISRNEYNSIISKIRNLRVDSLKEFYEAPCTDLPTLCMSITHGDTITRSAAIGHNRELMELHLLFGKLMNLYKTIQLQPDSSVHEFYFLNNSKISPMILPLSPPPPPLRKNED